MDSPDKPETSKITMEGRFVVELLASLMLGVVNLFIG